MSDMKKAAGDSNMTIYYGFVQQHIHITNYSIHAEILISGFSQVKTRVILVAILASLSMLSTAARSAGTESGTATLLGLNSGTNLNGSAADNTFIGNHAGFTTTSGSKNTFIGDSAGWQNTTGERNTFIGEETGASNTTGVQNTLVGENGGAKQTTANNNTFVGQNTGFETTTGSSNTFIGQSVGYNTTTGGSNTFVGQQSGQANTVGSQNTFVGQQSGVNNTIGARNTLIGENSGFSQTTASDNSFLGKNTGLNTTTGYENTFIGSAAGHDNNLGLQNTYIGHDAGSNNVNGITNTMIGHSAGSNNVFGNGNVFLGYAAGIDETGSYKLYIESSAATDPLIYGEFINNIVGINGDLGVGTQMPGSALHVRRSDGSAQAFIEENSGTTSPRTLVNLQNNGRPEIVMGNTGTGGEWSFGAGSNFILKQGAIGTDSSAKTKHLTLYSSTGNLEISGSIITGGPSCTAGCDAVFNDDYELPSIDEHASKMYELGHLPNVGPTRSDQPINLTEHMSSLLNELEHAHIFIAQLKQSMDRQDSIVEKQQADIEDYKSLLTQQSAAIAALSDRLGQLEVRK